MQNRVDFLKGLDRATGPGNPSPRARAGQRGQRPSGAQPLPQPVGAPPQVMSVTPTANQVDGTASGIPNLGRMFSEALQPQLRSMIPTDQQGVAYSTQPQFGMNTQGY